MGKGRTSTNCATTGYRYFAGIHQILCQGPIDAVTVLEVGDRVAWSGSSAGGDLGVNAPQLFGGDAREGGVYGPVRIWMGGDAQAADLYLAEQVGRTSGARSVVLEARLSGAGGTLAAAVTVAGLADTGSLLSIDVDAKKDIWTALAYDPEDPETSQVQWVSVSEMSLVAAIACVVDLRRADTQEVIGTIAVGAKTQTLDWETELGVGDMPAYRGVVGAVWEHCGIGTNNPYLKDVRWQVRRQTPADGWYSDKAAVGAGMNPAHILHELVCSSVWGLGYPAIACDDAKWQAAADTLYDEGLGLNLIWEDGSIEDFAQLVVDHIDGRLYVDPTSGLWVLGLIRADYVVADLPVVGAASVVEVESYERRGWDETVNQVTVTYVDWTTGKEATVTVQNPANIAVQGAVVGTARAYPGLGTANLAARIAQRDLNVLSRPLARVRLRVNRQGWSWVPGQAVLFQWPDYGVAEQVFRVVAIDTGRLEDGQIQVDLIEDVWGIPAASYIVPQPPVWIDPASNPLPCPHQALIEAPYWDVARALSAADLADLDPESGFVLACGERPNGVHYDYRLHSDDGAGYVARALGAWTPTAVLAVAVTPAETTLTLANAVLLGNVVVDTWAQIGGELVAVRSVGVNAVDVDRGVLDTTPVSHAAGTRIWFAGGSRGEEGVERIDGESISVKLQTRTGLGLLALDDASASSLTLDARLQRPYPPGNVTINGQSWPTALTGDLTVAWAHRDRTQQTAYLVAQDEGNIGPEPGTTYTLRAYHSGTGALMRSWTGLSGTSQVYADGDMATDFQSFAKPLRLTLEAQRDGLTSWQTQTRTLMGLDVWNPSTTKVLLLIDEAVGAPGNYTNFDGTPRSNWGPDLSSFQALGGGVDASVLLLRIQPLNSPNPVWPYAIGGSPPVTIVEAPRCDPEILVDGNALTGAWIHARCIDKWGTSGSPRALLVFVDISGSMVRASVAPGLDEFESDFTAYWDILELNCNNERWLRWLVNAATGVRDCV